MIQAIDLTKFRNPEYIQFLKQFLEIVNRNNQSTLKVEQEYEATNAVLVQIETLFKTDQASAITPIIEALDMRRDAAIMGIYKNVDSFVNHFAESKKEAAITIMDQLNVYGNASAVAFTSLPAETAIVVSLVTDLSTKPTLIAAVNELGLASWIDELKTANDQLNEKYVDRTVELGAVNPNNIKDKRLEANATYYALRDMITSQATVQRNADPYPKTMNEINALIDQYNVLLAGRASNTANPTTDVPVAPAA
jgi:hypothetical protein